MIDYIESSPALLPLLIFLVFTHTHMHTQSERQRVRRSHQSENNILLRRPFTAHSHKSPRQSHHPHCQCVIMHTRAHARTHSPGPCSSRQTFIQALSVAVTRMSSNGRNMTRKPRAPAHFTCADSALALLKRRGCIAATTGRSVSRLQGRARRPYLSDRAAEGEGG